MCHIKQHFIYKHIIYALCICSRVDTCIIICAVCGRHDDTLLHRVSTFPYLLYTLYIFVEGGRVSLFDINTYIYADLSGNKIVSIIWPFFAYLFFLRVVIIGLRVYNAEENARVCIWNCFVMMIWYSFFIRDIYKGIFFVYMYIRGQCVIEIMLL